MIVQDKVQQFYNKKNITIVSEVLSEHCLQMFGLAVKDQHSRTSTKLIPNQY